MFSSGTRAARRAIAALGFLSLRRRAGLAACAAIVCAASTASAQWTRLSNDCPGGITLMLLLTDGTVLAQEYAGANWHRLTPDSSGSYVHGQWDLKPVPPMSNWRKFCASAVLRDGRVFVAGGEYGGGNATTSAEIFDPQANGGAGAWTQAAPIPTAYMDPSKSQTIGDSESVLLPNGDVLLGPVIPSPAAPTLIYHVATNDWSPGPATHGGQDEASWVKLPDGTILTTDNANNTAERYDPVSNTWIVDAGPALPLYAVGETGPALMLPNGKAFFLGGLGFTGLYTPSGTTAPGSWTVGPNIPSLRQCGDAPAAMMIDGNVLCIVGDQVFNGGEGPPVYFYEYRSATNDFIGPILSPQGTGTDNIYAAHLAMLQLPDGNVLYARSTTDVYTFTPGPKIASGPTIWSVSDNPDGSYHLIGTGLNGFSAGVSFGDDYQMDTNYPLVRLTGGDGKVHYCRTFNWSSTGVSTSGQLVSTEFSLPSGLATGTYTLETVVNGFNSGGRVFHYTGAQPSSIIGTGNTTVIDPIGTGNDNGNGKIDPGENYVEFYVELENLSFSNLLTSVNGTLTTTDPYVTILSSTSFYNDMGPLATSYNQSPYIISVDRLRPCGTPIAFTVTARADVADGVYSFSLPTGPVCTPPTDAPGNDACAGAFTVVENTIYTGSTALATTDGSSTCGGNSTGDVWFKYTAAGTGLVNISTCGSNFDTVLSLYSGCPGTGANQLACNDDSSNGGNGLCGVGSLQSGLTFQTARNSTYLIRLAGYNGASGSYNLVIQPVIPANDACASAIPIGPGSYTGFTGFATADGSSVCGGVTGPDVWYAITPAASGLARLDTCGSTYDTLMSVHTACPGTAANQLACNDDAPPFTSCAGTIQSAVHVRVNAGTTYYVRVGSYNANGGAYVLNYSLDSVINDTCDAATPVTFGTYIFNTTGATTDGPTESKCGFCCGDTQINQDVWFSITAPCGRAITFDTLGSTFDTKIAVYAGCPTAADTAVVCNDDFGGTSQSSVTLTPVSGTNYKIRVGGYLATSGVGVLHVKTCKADFNCSGTVTVQDIFDFLAAWFAHTAAADFNASGAITVQDIFDFLSAWFAGC